MDGWNDRYRRFEEEAVNYVKKVRIQDFEHSSYCSLKHKYFYGESPKTACSTIKKVLIQAELGQQIDFEYDMFMVMHVKSNFPNNNAVRSKVSTLFWSLVRLYPLYHVNTLMLFYTVQCLACTKTAEPKCLLQCYSSTQNLWLLQC